MQFKEIFISRMGAPYCLKSLYDYIDFVINESTEIDGNLYFENHHLLPKCMFNDYVSNQDNIFRLNYNDHVHAHVLLSRAYPIREFLRTLNFMLPKSERELSEYRSLLSIAARESWTKFRKTEKYRKFVKKRSVYMSKKMSGGLARELSMRAWNKPGSRKRASERFKKLWSCPEYKERIRQSMIRERNTPEAKERLSTSSQQRWNNMTFDERNTFREKMDIINKSETKRAKASVALKQKWTQIDYIEKMKKRKKNPGKNYLIISPNGESIAISKFTYMIEKYNFHPAKVREYMNTGLKVQSGDYRPSSEKAKIQLKNTINWEFKEII